MQNFFIWEADLEAAGLSACGMFSPTHLIVTFFCLVALVLALWFTRKMSDEQFRKLVFVFAVYNLIGYFTLSLKLNNGKKEKNK